MTMIMDYLKYPNHSIYHNIIFLKETISIRKIVISKNSQKMIILSLQTGKMAENRPDCRLNLLEG